MTVLTGREVSSIGRLAKPSVQLLLRPVDRDASDTGHRCDIPRLVFNKASDDSRRQKIEGFIPPLEFTSIIGMVRT